MIDRLRMFTTPTIHFTGEGKPEYEGISKMLTATTFKLNKTAHHKEMFDEMDVTHKRTASNREGINPAVIYSFFLLGC